MVFVKTSDKYDLVAEMFKDELSVDQNSFKNMLINDIQLDGIEPAFDNVLPVEIFSRNIYRIFEHMNNLPSKMVEYLGYAICNTGHDNFLVFDFTGEYTEWKVSISKELQHRINKCLTDHNVNFMVIPIALLFKGSGHANVLFIDKQKQTVEYFEPHGILMYTEYNNVVSISEVIEKNLFSLFTPLSWNNGYVFLNINGQCFVGPQVLQESSFSWKIQASSGDGHCLAWVLYYIYLRILNINTLQANSSPASVLMEYITTTNDPEQLDYRIRRFITLVKHVASTVDENVESYINKLDIHTKMILNDSVVSVAIKARIMYCFKNITTINSLMKWSFIEELGLYTEISKDTYSLLQQCVAEHFSKGVDLNLYRYNNFDYNMHTSVDPILYSETIETVINFLNSWSQSHMDNEVLKAMLVGVKQRYKNGGGHPDIDIFPSMLLHYIAKLYTDYMFMLYNQNN